MHLVRLICLIQCDLCHWHRSASTTSCSYFRMSRSLFRIQGQKAAAHYISTADVAFVQLCIPELLIRSRRVAKLWACKPLPCNAGNPERHHARDAIASLYWYLTQCTRSSARSEMRDVGNLWSHGRILGPPEACCLQSSNSDKQPIARGASAGLHDVQRPRIDELQHRSKQPCDLPVLLLVCY